MDEPLKSSASFFSFHTRLQRSALYFFLFFFFGFGYKTRMILYSLYVIIYFWDDISEYTEEPRKTLLNDAGPRGGRNFFYYLLYFFHLIQKTVI